MKTYFKKQIALPQDHGSWVFILSPLLIGIFVSGQFTYASLALVVAAMLPWFAGLVVVAPVLGHASWHAYRAAVA